jgi:hypothetical protein
MRCAGKMKHLLWRFIFTKWGLLARDRERYPQPGEVCLFYRDVFMGLRWGSVCEAMLVYCDDAFDLRRLF